MLGAKPRRNFVQGEIARGRERQQRHLSVEHREIDVASLAGARSAGQRGEDGDRDPQTGAEVRHRQPRLDRAAATLAGQAHDAAHRLEHRVVALLLRVGPVLAEAGAGHINQPWIQRRQDRIVQPIASKRADRKILQYHVGLFREAADQRLALLGAQVDGDRLLGAIAGEVVRAVLLELRLEAARLVAAARLLDLDHARAELGEDHRGERARQHARKIKDQEPVEWLHFLLSCAKLRMRLLVSRPRSSAGASARSATSWNRRLVSAIAGRFTDASFSANEMASARTCERGTTLLTMPNCKARGASIGSPSATSSNAALRPTCRTRFAITIAATMPCFASG